MFNSCCGCCTLHTGSYIIGIFGLLVYSAQAIFFLVAAILDVSYVDRKSLLALAILSIIAFVASIFLLYGTYMQEEIFLMVWIVIMLLAMFTFGVLFCMGVLLDTDEDPLNKRHLCNIFVLFFHVYMILIIISYYVEVSLRALFFGSCFLTWFAYLTFASGFMMQCIFPNEYQREEYGAPAAMKTTMVFSALGLISSAMVCCGVHSNNELLFVPFLALVPAFIVVHIIALIVYNFVWSLVILLIITIVILIYAWIVVWSYYTELLYAYEEELPPPIYE